MASILICCTPAHGHVYPLLTVARHLVAEGHDVRMLTGTRYRDSVTAAGVEFIPMPPGADIDLDHTNDLFPERAAMKPIPQLRFSVIECFIKPGRFHVQAVEDAIAARPVDVILSEMMFVGSALLVRRPLGQRPPILMLGIFPLAAKDPDVAPYGLGITPLPGPVGRLRNRILEAFAARMFAPVFDAANEIFKDVNGVETDRFAAMDMVANSDMLLQFTVPEFEYPRSTLPDTVRFVGPMTRTAPTTTPMPDWWGDLDGRTVVHVSQGTIANSDPTELIIPTMQALAQEDVLVVVSTGGRPVETLGILPANARAAEYLPYDKLFPRLSVFVTNGGYGGLHFALQHGVPIVASGTSEDKTETNARVRWSGTGVSLRTQRPSAARIRAAVRKVLDDPGYRARSEHFSAAIDASPGLTAIDQAIEDLVAVSRTA